MIAPMKSVAIIAIAAIVTYWRTRKQRKSPVLKPQTQFCQVLADNSDTPFEHLQVEYGLEDSVPLVHPFQQQILELRSIPPSILSRDMAMPQPVEQCDCKWIASLSDLQLMVHSLQGVEALAVDVEHHHLHSYLGFVCLLQLSTGKTDYLIDALALHDHVHLLRPIFADPLVLKVVHGGDNDVLWLQRDFHIYMVNVFDTEKACQVLGRHHRSLAKLLEVYCHVSTDKSFQKSDWRVRPLSQAQQAYAQRDSHYLLYLAHALYQELQACDGPSSNQKDKSKVMQTWAKCQRVSLSLYNKPRSQAAASAAAATVLRSHAVPPSTLADIKAGLPDQDPQQVVSECVRALCQWRDDVARNEDEGLQAILPDAVLMAVAAARPSSSSALITCAQEALDSLHRATPQQGILLTRPTAVPAWLYQQADQVCKLLADVAEGLGGAQGVPGPSNPSAGNANQAKQLQTPEQRQAALKARLVKKFSAKSAVYENCKMLSQDGELLCFCDLRKLTWYENRGLAERISDDPPTIRLRFMHRTGDQERGVDDYYLHSKENKCVSCGEDGHYLRYRVVPACYRRNFPVQWKSHRSHDIVLLCVDCHHVAHRAAEAVKKQLSQQYGVPLFPPKVRPEATSGKASEAHPYNVRRAAVALKVYGNTLPEPRRRELQSMVRGFVNLREESAHEEDWLSQEELEQGLLAGLAPRQRRRMLRQLAAEKDQARKAATHDHIVTDDCEVSQPQDADSEGAMQHQLALAQPESSAIAAYTAQDDSIPNAADTAEGDGHPTPGVVHKAVQDNKEIVEPDQAADIGQDIDHEDIDHDATDTIRHLDGQYVSISSESKSAQHKKGVSNQGVSDEDSNGHAWHGRQVVNAALAEDGSDALLVLIQRFRQSFTDALHPKYLPAAWHVMHRLAAP